MVDREIHFKGEVGEWKKYFNQKITITLTLTFQSP